jgi:hypothetical protein
MLETIGIVVTVIPGLWRWYAVWAGRGGGPKLLLAADHHQYNQQATYHHP